MSHKFDIKNKHKLNSAKRRKLLPPFKVLLNMGIKEGDVIADIGCGIGYFTFPASTIVGNLGKILAMDISREMLKEVDKKINEKDISNIETVLTDENDLKIPDKSVDIAFISNVFHETKDKEKFLNEVNRIIADDGRIGIVEWRKIENKMGPPLEHRLREEFVSDLLKDIGYKNIRNRKIGEYFYSITGEK